MDPTLDGPITHTGAITDDERAELNALRAAKANAAALVADPNTPPADAASEPTDGYDFNNGEVVQFARPDGTTGYGIIVDRAPMSVVTPEGKTLAGYKVAQFGPCNDMPASVIDLGLEKLTTSSTADTATLSAARPTQTL
jgi:hypothetical protein